MPERITGDWMKQLANTFFDIGILYMNKNEYEKITYPNFGYSTNAMHIVLLEQCNAGILFNNTIFVSYITVKKL